MFEKQDINILWLVIMTDSQITYHQHHGALPYNFCEFWISQKEFNAQASAKTGMH